jgi:hypothetical protein
MTGASAAGDIHRKVISPNPGKLHAYFLSRVSPKVKHFVLRVCWKVLELTVGWGCASGEGLARAAEQPQAIQANALSLARGWGVRPW